MVAPVGELAASQALDLAAMSESFFSSHWYRVSDLTPRLSARAEVSRHTYRGKGWYVVYDPATARVHRFTPEAWSIIGRMTGQVSVGALWEKAVQDQGDAAPSQDDVVRLLAQLHAADVIDATLSPETSELLERHQKHVTQQIKQRLLNPMALRLPLVNPDRFLQRTLPVARICFSTFGAVIWCCAVLAGLIVTGLKWPELTEGLLDQVLTAENLLILWFAYPLVKALHELGHGYASKLRDSPVYEMGVMFLVFFPVPYVDASPTAALPDKRGRAFVAAAGILVELFVAAVAIVVWALLEPGFARSVALNVALIGGVSTLLLNGNPLLRFDGYYVLSDLIEIPNLGQKSNKFWGRIIERYGFGARRDDSEDPPLDRAERLWLIFYGPLAYVYRIALSLSIALLVSMMIFGLGILIACWTLFMSLVLPMLKHLRHVVTHQRLDRVRSRAIAMTSAGIAAVVALVFALPAPMWTNAEGVVWLPERAEVRVGTSGFLTDMLVPAGSEVSDGAALFRTEEPVLDTRIDVANAQLTQLELRYRAAMIAEPVRAVLLSEEVAEQRATRDREIDEQKRQIIPAQLSGTFVVPRADDLQGRFVNRGQLLGYVIEPELRTIRAAVRQDMVDLVRHDLRSVEILFVADSHSVHPARVVREVPAAAFSLPSAALSTQGGGRIAADPREESGATALESYYQFDLALDTPLPQQAFGSRVLVRFVHEWQPIGWQIWRRARLLVMRQLNV